MAAAVGNQSGPHRRVILIGIGGSSASGKSTVAAGLAKELNSPLKVFSADHYLDFNRVQRVGSWETPAGIAWDDLRVALENVVTTLAEAEFLPPSLKVGGFSRGSLDLIPHGQAGKLLGPDPVVVLIEGFLLFHDKKLCEMLDASLWLDSDCDVCAERRWKREGQRGQLANYIIRFRREVWHHYELYRGEQLANVPKVLCLDSALEPCDVAKEALTLCKTALEPRSNEAEPSPQDTSKNDAVPAGFMKPSSQDTSKKDVVPAGRRVILVGIGGSSASGKSTLAAGLAKEFDSPLKVFSADHYLDFNRVRRAGSWETPAGIAWDELRSTLNTVANKLSEAERLPASLVVGGFSRGPLELVPRGQAGKALGPEPVVIIIEGFLLFHDKTLCDMLDVSVWLDSDCDMCARRRWNREGRPGAFEQYIEDFRKEVWHHYDLYRADQLGNVPQVLKLNGALEPQQLISQAAVQCSAVFNPAQRAIEATTEHSRGEATLPVKPTTETPGMAASQESFIIKLTLRIVTLLKRAASWIVRLFSVMPSKS